MRHEPELDDFSLALIRCGEVFMHCIWIQRVMVYLIILSQNEKLKKEFITSHPTLPHELVTKRTEWLKRPFSEIFKNFRNQFNNIISEGEQMHLDFIKELRDMIGHCDISLGRKYILWKPRNNFVDRIKVFGLEPDPNNRHSLLLLDLTDEKVYIKCFTVIKNLDEFLMKRVAEHLSIPHGRIR